DEFEGGLGGGVLRGRVLGDDEVQKLVGQSLCLRAHRWVPPRFLCVLCVGRAPALRLWSEGWCRTAVAGGYRAGQAALRPGQVSAAAPQVSPPPNAVSSTRDPVVRVPAAAASDSASGTDAAEVFPTRSRLTTARSSGRPSRWASALRMRMLAW